MLVALAALLRCTGVTDAAHALDVSQPAMSKLLERLRRDFDDALPVRDGNRMVPTPKAQQFLPLVDAALDQLDRVVSGHGPFDPSAASWHVRVGAKNHLLAEP